MDPEIEELVRENNEILRKMQRAQVRGKVYRALYWIIIIVMAVAAFYFIQPYVESVRNAYDTYESARQNAEEGTFSESDLSNILETIR